MKRFFCSEFAFWIFTTVLLAVALTVGLKGQGDPGDMPEEGKPASCDNFAQTAPSHKCACGKAMHSDCDKPDPDVAMDGFALQNLLPQAELQMPVGLHYAHENKEHRTQR